VKRNTQYLTVILIWMGVILACGSSNDAEATAQAINDIFSKTATAAVSEVEDSENVYLTAQVEATEQAKDLKGTGGEANSGLDSVSLQATAEAEAPIIGELTLYGIDPEKGHVAWIHAPAKLDVEGYMALDYANDYPETIVQDFVIAADITWNTQYGSSGCGYMLRSNGNQNSADQYLALIQRGGNGHLVFAIIEKGEPVGGYDIFPRTYDKSFDWHNETTNRVAVVGSGGIFTFFTNGVWVGEIDLNQPPPTPVMPAPPQIPADQTNNNLMNNYRQQLADYEKLVTDINNNHTALLGRNPENNPIFEKGFVGMISISESGRSICQFDDIWLWIIEP